MPHSTSLARVTALAVVSLGCSANLAELGFPFSSRRIMGGGATVAPQAVAPPQTLAPPQAAAAQPGAPRPQVASSSGHLRGRRPVAVAGPACGANLHASAGHCCAPGEDWVPRRRRCVCTDLPVCGPRVAVNAAPTVVCADGQHVSSGRCCNQGEDWVPAQSRCVCIDSQACGQGPTQLHAAPEMAAPPPVVATPTAAPPSMSLMAQVNACMRGGDGQACDDAGVAYRDGAGVGADDAQAVLLFRRGCTMRDPDCCVDLGWMTENGRGTRQDAGRAVALYRQGCEAGSMLGCDNVGICYRDGRGVGVDRVQAQTFFQRACDGGSQAACTHVAELAPPTPPSEDCNTVWMMRLLARVGGLDQGGVDLIHAQHQAICPANGSAAETWSNGQTARYAASGDWNYPNGTTARYGASGDWNYPTGTTARYGASGDWNYPNGNTARYGASGQWQTPSGQASTEDGIVQWACGVLGQAGCQPYVDDARDATGLYHEAVLVELAWRAQSSGR